MNRRARVKVYRILILVEPYKSKMTGLQRGEIRYMQKQILRMTSLQYFVLNSLLHCRLPVQRSRGDYSD